MRFDWQIGSTVHGANKNALAVLEHDQSDRPDKGIKQMKPNRARHNAGKSRTASQSESNPKNAPGQPPAITLGIVQWSGKRNPKPSVTDIILPPDLKHYLAASLSDDNKNIDNFVIAAFREKIARDESQFSVPTFELVMQQGLAIIDLFEAKLLDVYQERMSKQSAEYDAAITETVCGYMRLARDSKSGLHEQFRSVCAFVRAKQVA